MDGAGTAAAILQLAGTAVKTSITLYDTISTIKNAPKEILHLRKDIGTLTTLLRNLELSLESPNAQRLVDQDEPIRNMMGNMQGLIGSCQNCCSEVTKKLSSFSEARRGPLAPSVDSMGSNTESGPFDYVIKEEVDIRKSILWIFRRRGIFAAVHELQKTKAILSDSMGTITLTLVMRIAELKNNGEDLGQVAHQFDDDVGSAIMDWVRVQPHDPEETIGSESISIVSETPTQQLTSKVFDPHMIDEFLGAVRRGSIPVVTMLLDKVDVDAQDPRDGRTALSIAAETGDLNMAKLLLAYGASVHIRQYSRNCWEHGGQPFYTAGRNAIHWAAGEGHSDVVELLLNHGANPNSANTIGRSALQEAVRKHDVRSVRLLLDNGADVNFRNFYHGWRPIHEACVANSTEMIYVLLEYKPLLDVNVEFWGHRKTPLQYAVVHRNLQIMKAFLSNGADPDNNGMWENNTALHIAAAAGWLDGIELLLAFNASIDPIDAYLRETPLHKAARNGETKACELLCARGADTAKCNVDGQNYQNILDCAQRYPDDWKINPDEVYFLAA